MSKSLTGNFQFTFRGDSAEMISHPNHSKIQLSPLPLECIHQSPQLPPTKSSYSLYGHRCSIKTDFFSFCGYHAEISDTWFVYCLNQNFINRTIDLCYFTSQNIVLNRRFLAHMYVDFWDVRTVNSVAVHIAPPHRNIAEYFPPDLE